MDVPAPDERGDSAVPHVEFVGVDKSYDGRNLVVRGLDLAVERGEFLTLLGPSGSGKTTCLMMLAGFEAATAGTILIGGRRNSRAASSSAWRLPVPWSSNPNWC